MSGVPIVSDVRLVTHRSTVEVHFHFYARGFWAGIDVVCAVCNDLLELHLENRLQGLRTKAGRAPRRPPHGPGRGGCWQQGRARGAHLSRAALVSHLHVAGA